MATLERWVNTCAWKQVILVMRYFQLMKSFVFRQWLWQHQANWENKIDILIENLSCGYSFFRITLPQRKKLFTHKKRSHLKLIPSKWGGQTEPPLSSSLIQKTSKSGLQNRRKRIHGTGKNIITNTAKTKRGSASLGLVGFEAQLPFEQHGFELYGSTYM